MAPPSTLPSGSPSRRLGLVLGAGGAAGAAYHAGTLLALQHDVGWDPNSADVILGSSAGSIVGALLRAGLSTDDLAAWGAAVDARVLGRESRRALDQARSARHRLAPSLPRPRVPSLALCRSLLPPNRLPLHTAALTLLPHGWIDASRSLERLGQQLVDWPEDPLWVTAVRLADARRVVFGRDDTSVTPGQAVAASCAIPGFFTPVRAGGHRYIDGGSHSPTNADLLADAGVDVVIILSPMTAQSGAVALRPDRPLRAMLRRRLHAERDQLVRHGIDVHILEPDEATLAAMGTNALDSSRSPAVVRHSFLGAGAQLAASPDLAAVLRRHADRIGPDVLGVA